MAAPRIYRLLSAASPAQRASILAMIVMARVQALGMRQVRLYRGRIRTYPFPAPRGYGTRGLLIGIYSAGVQPEWIEEDIQFLSSGERA